MLFTHSLIGQHGVDHFQQLGFAHRRILFTQDQNTLLSLAGSDPGRQLAAHSFADVAMVSSANRDAAAKNGVHYYPILVGHEKESWDTLIAEGYEKLRSGEYDAYGAQKQQEFLQNLGAE